MPPFLLSLLSTVAALAVVLGLAYLLLRLLRGRWSGAGGVGGMDANQLRFLRALPVGPKERVVLMAHQGERWMLGVTAGGISLLARWPDDTSTPDRAPAPDLDTPASPRSNNPSLTAPPV